MNSLGLLLLPGGIPAKSRSPSRMQDSRGWRGQRVTDQALRDPFWLWHFTSMHYLSLQKRSAGYTATRFKPWPLTSTCNWRHSSKWQNAFRSWPHGIYVTTSCQQWLPLDLLQQKESILCRLSGHPSFSSQPHLLWVHEIWSLSPPSKQEKDWRYEFLYRKSDAEPRSEGGFWESRITPSLGPTHIHKATTKWGTA